MLRHALTIAFRRLVRQRFHTGVSILILTLGLICFIGANVFVSYVRGHDRHFAAADRMYVIAERILASDFGYNARTFTVRSDPPLAEHLRIEAPELAAVARSFALGGRVTVDDRRMGGLLWYVEPSFTEIFELTALDGDVRQALATPRSAVITRRSAERLFGAVDVAGRTMMIEGQQPIDVTITAVVADPPSPSHLVPGPFAQGFVALVSWDVLESLGRLPASRGWGSLAVTTYALLPEDGRLTVAELDRRLARIVADRIPEEWRFLQIDLEAWPVSSIAAMTLQTDVQGGAGASIGWLDILSALLVAAGAILAFACLNYANLAVAQVSGRTLDVSTRKVLGATTLQIVGQDLLQTSLLVLVALVLATVAIVPLGHLLPEPWSASLVLPWRDARLYLFLGATFLGVTLAAGLYPAMLMSTAQRVAAARLGLPRDAFVRLRTVVVGLQFAAASVLIVAAIVLLLQRNELHDALVGRLPDQYVGFSHAGLSISPDVLADELARGPGIEGTTAIWATPFQSWQQRRLARSRDNASSRPAVNFLYVGHDYFALMNVPLLAGRVFARDRADDAGARSNSSSATPAGPISLVLDRVAARVLGWEQPEAAVGELVYGPGGSAHQVVGVVEFSPTSVRRNGTQGNAFVLNPSIASFRIVRIASDRLEAGLAHVDEVVKTLFAGLPVANHFFFDFWFEIAYRAFEWTTRVLIGLAVFALLIAGVGLFGTASYLVSQRTREIGIRKCQGAAPLGLVRLLLWELSRPVVVANVLAWPLALIAVDRYLALFSERVAITPLPFVLALLATWSLACVAVGARVWQAARLYPADALRHVG